MFTVTEIFCLQISCHAMYSILFQLPYLGLYATDVLSKYLSSKQMFYWVDRHQCTPCILQGIDDLVDTLEQHWQAILPNLITHLQVSAAKIDALSDPEKGKMLANSGLLVVDAIHHIIRVSDLISSRHAEELIDYVRLSGDQVSTAEYERPPLQYILVLSHDSTWDCWNCRLLMQKSFNCIRSEDSTYFWEPSIPVRL